MVSLFASISSKRVRALAWASFAAGVFALQPIRPVMLVGFSMAPTYVDHEIVLAVQYRGQPLHRGDVVVVKTEDGPIIKRIAYLPGQMVEQVLGDGWTDDFTESSLRVCKKYGSYRSFHVPEGQLYLRGDNSSVSIDSRQLGLFSFETVEYVLLNARPKPSDVAVSKWCFKYL
jgi:signal peptidase I